MSKKVVDLLFHELEDDDSLFGGISFIGETVKDFLDETNLPYDITIKQLNCALRECGIKTI